MYVYIIEHFNREKEIIFYINFNRDKQQHDVVKYQRIKVKGYRCDVEKKRLMEFTC